MPGYLFAFDREAISRYGLKPWLRVESYILGISLAMLYQKIEWYRKEATKKEKKREKCLEWLHHTNVAPFFLWFGSLICGFLYFLTQMHIDILGFESTSGE